MSFFLEGGHSIVLPYCLSLDLSYLPTTPCMLALPQIWLSWVTPQVIPGWWIHSHGSSHDPHLAPTYSPLLNSGTTFATPPLDTYEGSSSWTVRRKCRNHSLPFPSTLTSLLASPPLLPSHFSPHVSTLDTLESSWLLPLPFLVWSFTRSHRFYLRNVSVSTCLPSWLP